MTAAAIRPTVETKPQHHQPSPQTKSNSYSILSFKSSIRQFGIRKYPKKLVISLLFCNFIVENQ